jgi:urate oxidase
MARVAFAEYGKDNVRICKIERNAETGVHTVTEMTVCCVLQGDIETSYTKADNSVVVATDSIKNTVYIKAKEHPVDPPELFASFLGSHFVSTYPHIHVAHINVTVARWARMQVDGKPHPHSFFRDSEETRTVEAFVRRGEGIDLRSGAVGLTVLKSTGSAFHGFVRDEYTTLPETWDRILSTVVDCGWAWKRFADVAAVQDGVARFNDAWAAARDITMKTFATDDSASVQNTMYQMCEQILAAAPDVQSTSYALPNKHYFEIDLSWHKGTKNTGKDAEVYAPQANPNGLIKCEVSRS